MLPCCTYCNSKLFLLLSEHQAVILGLFPERVRLYHLTWTCKPVRLTGINIKPSSYLSHLFLYSYLTCQVAWEDLFLFFKHVESRSALHEVSCLWISDNRWESERIKPKTGVKYITGILKEAFIFVIFSLLLNFCRTKMVKMLQQESPLTFRL